MKLLTLLVSFLFSLSIQSGENENPDLQKKIDYEKIHKVLSSFRLQHLPEVDGLRNIKAVNLSHKKKLEDHHVETVTHLPEVFIWVFDASLLTEKSISYFSRTVEAYSFASVNFKYFTVQSLGETFKNHKNIKAILLSDESNIDRESSDFQSFLKEHPGLKGYFGEKEKNSFKRYRSEICEKLFKDGLLSEEIAKKYFRKPKKG